MVSAARWYSEADLPNEAPCGGLYVSSLGPTKLSSCVRSIRSYLENSTAG